MKDGLLGISTIILILTLFLNSIPAFIAIRLGYSSIVILVWFVSFIILTIFCVEGIMSFCSRNGKSFIFGNLFKEQLNQPKTEE